MGGSPVVPIPKTPPPFSIASWFRSAGYTAVLKAEETSRPIIAVDIDGILTQEHTGPRSEPSPRPENVARMGTMYRSGKYLVVLYTARPEEARGETVAWLSKHGIPYHRLVMDKLVYDLLIDDKALPSFPGTSDSDQRLVSFLTAPTAKSEDPSLVIYEEVEKGIRDLPTKRVTYTTRRGKHVSALRHVRRTAEKTPSERHRRVIAGTRPTTQTTAGLHGAFARNKYIADHPRKFTPELMRTLLGFVGEPSPKPAKGKEWPSPKGYFVTGRGKKTKPSKMVLERWRRISPGYRHMAFVNADPNASLSHTFRGESRGRSKWQDVRTEKGEVKSFRTKFARVRNLLRGDFDQIRRIVEKDYQNGNQTTAPLTLLTMEGVRIGSGKVETGTIRVYKKGKKPKKVKMETFGASSLQIRHIQTTGGTLRVHFHGKGGKKHPFPITNPFLIQFLRDRKRTGKPEDSIFDVSDDTARNYLKNHPNRLLHPYQHHDFRKVLATRAAHTALKTTLAREGMPANDAAARKLVLAAATVAGDRIGDTPATALKTYTDPRTWLPLKAVLKEHPTLWTRKTGGDPWTE